MNSPRRRRYPCGWKTFTRCRSCSTASLSWTRAAESCSIQVVCFSMSSLAFCSSRRTSSITCLRNSSGSSCAAEGFPSCAEDRVDEAPVPCAVAVSGAAAVPD
ncbi:MAG: hypothetical protein E6J85_07425 [Deltaproteobacteria bacterium]|nr:MAG: hypothetical protein E6J85_07425 [Deltaproteobacteria bacterium]